LIVTFNLILIFLHVRQVTLGSEKYVFPVQQQQQQQENQDSNPAASTATTDRNQESSRSKLQALSSSTRRVSGTLFSIRPTTNASGKSMSSICSSLLPDVDPHYGTMKKTCLPLVSFLLTCSLFLQLVCILQTIQPPKSVYALSVLAAMLTPMQGLPNFVVYLYPTYCRLRQKQPHQGCLTWLAASLGLRSFLTTSDGVSSEL
jgi:hypothetical protein